MARTMSDVAEKRLRRNARQHLCLGTDDTKALLAELDAERAAHEETKAQLKELAVKARLHKDETDAIETGEYVWERCLPHALALETMLQQLDPLPWCTCNKTHTCEGHRA